MDRDDERSTVLRPKFDPTPAPQVSFVLVVREGPDRGKSFGIDGSQPSRVILGQSPIAGFRLTDPAASRRHVALDIERSRLRITDLGSKNGTSVNGVSVLDAHLAGGESIRIGDTLLSVELKGAPAPPTAPQRMGFGRVVGVSSEMQRLYPLCELLAASSVPVIIEGETGTGKEVLAESLHGEGPRSAQPFLVFDCTAVPPTLVESELFGHERGAFTGAVGARAGVFEEAKGGTLLIDEIGDLDLSLQPKLLRAVERGEIRRVGATRSIRVDVRILAATRRDLDLEVQKGRFRDDLYHRLAVARVELPPLRARRGDIPLLVETFCEELGGNFSALPRETLLAFEDRTWPGNVRELRNAVARRLALGELADLAQEPRGKALRQLDDALAGVDFTRETVLESLMELPLGEARQRIVDEFERVYVERILARHEGNVTRAAEAAGIGRRYFQMLNSRRRRSGG